ncbi:hypothetical protein F7R91_14530 [Streptomyces luteolifulvus]|uniref:Uncharacterized protein n=1 Tax=Streptomyces luteolifulvus TaxID=2615112 RepID=A0A6H9V2D4_9ACTN|nr:hypothetical protein [Streptomyces luteolifulvus]KAB1146793.1 hypothetical protein F7R91_14530 [Streptomyces luteolifulvus]
MTDKTQQQKRPATPEEDIEVLYGRVAKLNDAVSALLNPNWGASMGILPEEHPLYPAALEPLPSRVAKPFDPAQEEQGAPVDWQAIAKQRERELKKIGEARHLAEAAVARVRKVIAERRTEVADRETDGMLPFGTPGASWCDAVTVTCDRIDDALRIHPEPVGIPCPPDQSEPAP